MLRNTSKPLNHGLASVTIYMLNRPVQEAKRTN